jgi:hypothetical protein
MVNAPPVVSPNYLVEEMRRAKSKIYFFGAAVPELSTGAEGNVSTPVVCGFGVSIGV